MKRTSIKVQGLGHGGAPTPTASLVGPLLVSGSISGVNPETGEVPPGINAQTELIFRNIGMVMAAAGGSIEDIVKLTFFARDRSVRPAIDDEWVRTFPDEENRPSRHLVISDIPPAVDLQCEIMAFLETVAGRW